MRKCQHPDCNHTGPSGLCEGHRELIKKDDHCALICYSCGGLVRVFKRPEKANPKVKYYFCYMCRNCGGDLEDEAIIIRQEI